MCYAYKSVITLRQIIKEGNTPVAVIIDYHEYKRLKDIEEEKDDYLSAVKTKKSVKKWKRHDELKKDLGI